MKKLYFWSRLNFSKYFIPQKLGKFRQHWSSQKSRSEVDDVKDRVIKWWNLVRYSILYQLRVTFLYNFPEKYYFHLYSLFSEILWVLKKNYSSFLIQPTTKFFATECIMSHIWSSISWRLYSLAVLKSTLLPKRPLKAIRTLLFSWRLLLLHDTYLRGRRKKKRRRSRVVLSSHFFSFWRFSCRK